MSKINEAQDQIIEEFSMISMDMEMTIGYIMEQGEKLPAFALESRTEKNIVKGCQSKVWMTAELIDGKVVYQGDSNTSITKGLVSLLIRVLSGNLPGEVIGSDIYFPSKIGMNRFIGTQRSNGFAAMIKQMKLDAAVLQQVNS